MDVVAKVEPNRVVTIQTVGEPVIRELGDFDLPGFEDVPYGTDRVGGGRPYRGGGTAWVIDTGVSLTHLDLRVDADRSVSFVDGEPTANDGNGHGTHVAGTIAARNNAFGVRGVAAGATVVGVKVSKLGYQAFIH